MSFFRNCLSANSLIRNERGNLIVILGILTIASVLGVSVSRMILDANKSFALKMRRSRNSIENSNAAETMLVAYRMAELKYASAISGSTCNPFLVALKNGAGPNPCVISGNSVTVWSSSDLTDPGVATNSITGNSLYSFPGVGCQITAGGSTCASGNPNIVNTSFTDTSMRTVASDIYGYKFYISGINLQAGTLTINASYSDSSGLPAKFSFSIKTGLPNSAHVDSDFKIVQENPDPLSYCSGKAFGLFNIFVPSLNQCVNFSKLGGGTGLALYNGIYFGFNPSSGYIFDYLAVAQGLSTTLVNEDGTLDGISVFPAHDREKMRFVDDITLISSQIYFVAHSGASAILGVFDPATFNRRTICQLGNIGYGQSYAGIAALGMSDPLVPPVGGDLLTTRLATFFLKTETGFNPPNVGPLLTAIVVGNAAGTSFSCSVFKDGYIQRSEYTRTYGFDRTDSSRPYYLN